jgi:hypothetical protein
MDAWLALKLANSKCPTVLIRVIMAAVIAVYGILLQFYQ